MVDSVRKTPRSATASTRFRLRACTVCPVLRRRLESRMRFPSIVFHLALLPATSGLCFIARPALQPRREGYIIMDTYVREVCVPTPDVVYGCLGWGPDATQLPCSVAA